MKLYSILIIVMAAACTQKPPADKSDEIKRIERDSAKLEATIQIIEHQAKIKTLWARQNLSADELKRKTDSMHLHDSLAIEERFKNW